MNCLINLMNWKVEKMSKVFQFISRSPNLTASLDVLGLYLIPKS